ncbi:FadR/GntR family transcriptional regulator [Paenibacillus humicola]|uniref:FadR/GntR family transcriptional regulator n=1 Tax=Paenibacillus humicola TaxID=3110540 RepID=UPI00237BA5AC|nr:FCD domain-containing protein [Paenibacillus humicola]
MRKKLTYEVVYDECMRRIREGVWKPGERLPSIEELAAELGVGISAVREAVRILSMQQILRVEQGRGTYVHDEIPADRANDHLSFLENASWMQLTEARLIIEPELAAMAAEKATADEAAKIVSNARLMQRKVKNGRDFLKEDMEFHRLVSLASHNDVMVKMIGVIGDLLLDSRRHTMRIPSVNEKAAAYHSLIAGAISKGDAKQARELMRLHIEDMIGELSLTHAEQER